MSDQSTIANETPISFLQKKEVRKMRRRIRLWMMEVDFIQVNNRRLKQDLIMLLPRLYECSKGCKMIDQYNRLLTMMGSAHSLMQIFQRAQNRPPIRPQRQQQHRPQRKHRNGPQRQLRRGYVRRFL